jgi:hypothetical protein
MSKFRLTRKVGAADIEALAADRNLQAVYSVATPWWSKLAEGFVYRSPTNGLPCDPRGAMLMQADFADFWKAAKEKPEHYGKHGLEAFVAAFHGNVEVETADGRGWLPTALNAWDDYNRLLDEKES